MNLVKKIAISIKEIAIKAWCFLVNLIKSFSKVFKSEFKSQFSVGIIVGIIIASLVPLIAPLAGGEIKAVNGGTIQQATVQQIARMFGESVIYTLIIRLIMLFRERTTVDRNRTLYLKYDKNLVLFGKSLVDALIFISSIALSMILGIMILTLKNHGELPSSFAGNIFAFAFALIFMYILMSMGIRWAISTINSKIYKGLLIALFVLITAGLYMVMGITEFAVSKTTAKGPTFPIIDTIVANKYVFMFVPLANVSLIPLVISGNPEIPAYTIIPFIFEVLIVVALIWRPLAKNLKIFLAS